MSKIEAKIATVISRYEIALNKGSVHGVELGQKVHLWKVISVKDPESKENLGSVRVSKGVMEITDVQERFSLAATPEPDYFNPLMAAVSVKSIFSNTSAPRTQLRASNIPDDNKKIIDVQVGEIVDILIKERTGNDDDADEIEFANEEESSSDSIDKNEAERE
ncbi:hypothetical protein [Lentzea sp. NEAU-D7]|uniref:hypothetical protein n=1 Tax=Lentzea sp. NEAU-D7 TaxID=2994667 RepID=UPI00224AADFE|nr:hypothetical protein [Lentzea sp. NEAU-D7]MCX2953576.1 hypothetical protein [Lentzea sp. NEAU-D7]